MKEIPLSRGRVALVDDADYEFLMQWKWHAGADGRRVYAKRSIATPDKKNRVVWMHRQITGCPDGWIVDHVNDDGLDNRKENLRLCTPTLNQVRAIRPRTSTPYRGLRKTQRGYWQVRMRVNGKNTSFETYRTPEEAARRYDELAKHFYGDFARLNFPE